MLYRCQCIQAVVELMVPECGDIIAHPVHCGYLHAPVIKIEIRSALTEVPGIHEQQITVLLAFPADESHPTGIAALAIGFRLHLRMGVVGMENGQMVLRGAGDDKNYK